MSQGPYAARRHRRLEQAGFDGIQLHTLYRRKASPGTNPGTARRRREVAALAREDLRHALEALDAGDMADLGTSGFTTREDVLGLEPLYEEGNPIAASPFLPKRSNNVKQGTSMVRCA